jgi:WD40 repeat protein
MFATELGGTVTELSELLSRVKDTAEQLSRVTTQGLNAPLDQYLDTVSLNALCTSLSLDPKMWDPEDLERILIVRDGLYGLRNRLRDEGSDAEHSVDQVLGGMDRLYADLERALREMGRDDIAKAQQHLARLQQGPHVPTAQALGAVNALKEEAAELLTQTFVSHRRIEFNIFKIENLSINIEVLKNAKVIVERLSASVFAIKLSLEQKVIFQGVFKLLSEGADKVLANLRDLLKQVSTSYGAAKDFLSDLAKLADKSGRFTKLIGDFLTKVFGDEPQPDRQIQLRIENSHQGVALSCAYDTGKGILLGGWGGHSFLIDAITGRITDQRLIGRETINAVSSFDGTLTAFGTDGGLELAATIGREAITHSTPYRERVTAVASVNWGAKGSQGALVTGSRDGALRRWTMATNFSQQGFIHTKRAISRIVVVGSEIVVASGSELLFVDEGLEIKRRIRTEQAVADMSLLNDATLAVCGVGHISLVNLAKGVFTRLVISSSDESYTGIVGISDDCLFVATETGKVIAIDFNSTVELGMLDLGFPIRGILRVGHRLMAYGGTWRARGKNVALITWTENQIPLMEDLGPAVGV